jgi:hypothetical protein
MTTITVTLLVSVSRGFDLTKPRRFQGNRSTQGIHF